MAIRKEPQTKLLARALKLSKSKSELAEFLGLSVRRLRVAESADLKRAIELGQKRARGMKASLKRRTPEALASEYDVTVRTAKRWKALGAIPTKAAPRLSALAVAEATGGRAKVRKFRKSIRAFSGEVSRGITVTSKVEGQLDLALVADLLRWAKALKPIPHAAQQLHCEFASERAYEEEDLEHRYHTVHFKGGDGGGRGDVKKGLIATKGWRKMNLAISELAELLYHAETYSVQILTIGYTARLPV